MSQSQSLKDRKRVLFQIVFETKTPAGKTFDVVLLVAIILSILVVMLESMNWLEQDYSNTFYTLEWGFTILFTIEYGLRLWLVKDTKSYSTSFFGIIDLLAILPTYLAIFLGGLESLIVVRSLRLLRVFRIFKLVEYWNQGQFILRALRSSYEKLFIFILFVFLLEVILGTFMYVVESPYNPGFSSIPESIYWAIVTLTTVGYGDIVPVTTLGKSVASVIMLLGYAIIAVPTGIVASEFVNTARDKSINTRACPNCSREGHIPEADYCKYCGEELLDEEED